MRSLISATATAAVLLTALAACGGDGNDSTSGSNDSVRGDAADGRESSEERAAKVLEAGFGQDPDNPQYVHAGAVVKGNAAAAGSFVIVSMNFLDETGQTIVTEQQTESFSWPDQELIIPVFSDLGGEDVVVASVEATVSFGNEGGSVGEPIPDPEKAVVTAGEYGGTSAKFTLANPTDEDLSSPRIGVLCRNDAGEIVGATSDYPDVVPASGEIVQNIDVTTGSEAATCEATMNYGY